MTTSDGLVVNSYQALDLDGAPLADPERIAEIREQLIARLTGPARENLRVTRTPSRQHRHFSIETRVCLQPMNRIAAPLCV